MDSGMQHHATVDEIIEKLKEHSGARTGMDASHARSCSQGDKLTDDGEVTTVEEHAVMVLRMIKEHLLRDNEMTKTIMRSLCEHMKTITQMLANHGKVIQTLIHAIQTSSDVTMERHGVKDTAKVLLKQRQATETECKGKKKDVTEVCLFVKRKGKKSTQPRRLARLGMARSRTQTKERSATSRASMKSPGFKRLNFDSEEHVANDINQTDIDSPFTYHTHPGSLHLSIEMPRCLDLAFRPPEGMNFVGSEMAVAAYIFGKGHDKSEVLVANEHSRGDRGVLWTLCPGERLMDDVINLVASMLTYDNTMPKWFLPTTFAQIALSPVSHSIDTFEFIRTRFMGFADNLMRIYVPLYKDGHWYLMIVDFIDCKLIYLDSLKEKKLRDGRVAQMKYVDFYIETMLDDQRFWQNPDRHKPHPSLYDIYEPTVGQQDPLSNDCGVWVSQWMMQSWMWTEFNIGDVTVHTRFRLAVDLVMGRYNPIATDVSRKAIEDWDVKMHVPAKEENAHNNLEKEPSPSLSVTF